MELAHLARQQLLGENQMSIRTGMLSAIGLCVALGFAGSASAEMAAPSKPAKAKTVTVSGCPTTGFPSTCTMLKAKGANYNISGAATPAPVGKKIRLKGTVTDKASVCGGIVLDDIKWMEVKGSCPKAM